LSITGGVNDHTGIRRKIMVTSKDKSILRELAKQVMDLADLDINKERIACIRKTHSLKPGRPVVWIEELPYCKF
jgi:hypothetical protein